MIQEGKVLLSTTPTLDGYQITEYLDIVAAETVYKLSLAKSFSSMVNNAIDSWRIFSSNELSGTTELLREATEYVKDQLTQKAKSLGANAVVGIDIETSVSDGDGLAKVSINGTAVKIKPITEEAATVITSESRYSIASTNANLPFRSSSLFVESLPGEKYALKLELFHPEELSISAVLVNVEFTDVFQSQFTIDLAFNGFKEEKTKYLISNPVAVQIPECVFRLLSSIKLTINKCILNDELKDFSGAEIEYDSLDTPSETTPETTAAELLSIAESMANAKEIYEYVFSYNEDHMGIIAPELIKALETHKNVERFYGNHKSRALKEIRKHFGLETEEDQF